MTMKNREKQAPASLAEKQREMPLTVANYKLMLIGLGIIILGRNLFMFYNKAPFDPEVTASTSTYYQGVDFFMQPSVRTLGFSVKLQF